MGVEDETEKDETKPNTNTAISEAKILPMSPREAKEEN
jgi:hypothetical protein